MCIQITLSLEINLDFSSMDMSLWQVFGIFDFFANKLLLWTKKIMNFNNNYYPIMQIVFFCARQINVLSIYIYSSIYFELSKNILYSFKFKAI